MILQFSLIMFCPVTSRSIPFSMILVFTDNSYIFLSCRCVGSIGGSEYATRKVKFECAPGTVFSEGLGICVHAYGSNCLSGPSLPLPSLAPLPVPVPTPAPLPPPGPPAPVGPPAPAPAPVGSSTCSPYEVCS